MPKNSPRHVTRILSRVASGSPEAIDELYPLVYDELRVAARVYLSREARGHKLHPTALVHETYLKMVGGGTALEWKDRGHFLAVAARAMRQILVDHARAERRAKRGGGKVHVTLQNALNSNNGRTLDLLDVADAIEVLSSLDERKGKVASLKLFSDMTFREIAGVLGIAQKTAEADWYSSRAWLRDRLGD